MLSLSVVVFVLINVAVCASKIQCVCIYSDNSTQKLFKQGENKGYAIFCNTKNILLVLFLK